MRSPSHAIRPTAGEGWLSPKRTFVIAFLKGTASTLGGLAGKALWHVIMAAVQLLPHTRL